MSTPVRSPVYEIDKRYSVRVKKTHLIPVIIKELHVCAKCNKTIVMGSCMRKIKQGTKGQVLYYHSSCV